MCHSGPQAPRELRLTDYESVLKGGIRPVIVPGNVQESLLVDHVSTGFMPLGGPPLSPQEVKLIADWVAAGAPNN